MNIFRKILGINKDSQDDISADERGKYMPDFKLPIDERFTINFKSNGGKFLYCENMSEVFYSLDQILLENDWYDKNVYLLDERIHEKFSEFELKSSRRAKETTYFLTTCEYLIADDGSLLISSNQIVEKKLHELPSNFVIFATTSQLVESIGDGLKGIKKSRDKIPTNITTIKHFKAAEDKDFLSYGSSSKNLYLLLLEDL